MKMSQMRCEVCRQGPCNGVTLYRTGGKGEGVNPHWRCEAHARDIDPELYEITSLLENAALKDAP